MKKPRIAIPSPTSFDLEYNAQSWPEYAEAVERSGGEAVEVPLHLAASAVASLMQGCQGILLPGSGADLNPQKYGQERIDACAAADPERERIDELLIQNGHTMYKPILGICFGLQSINVWRGGSLVQDLTPMPVNHVAGKAVAVAHSAMVVRKSVLGGMLPTEEADQQGKYLCLPVNSSHHQAVGIPGDGLRVVARCPQDGVIEALEGEGADTEHGHFVLGVQWHPERSYVISEASRSLFRLFVEKAAKWDTRSESGGRHEHDDDQCST